MKTTISNFLTYMTLALMVVSYWPTTSSCDVIDLGRGFGGDINNAGTVVVTTGDIDGFIRWNNGTVFEFPTGYSPTVINNNGVVAGTYLPVGAIDYQVFTWLDLDGEFDMDVSEVTMLDDIPSSPLVNVRDINDSGAVIGSTAFDGREVGWATFVDDGALDHPTDAFVYPLAINNTGRIVGATDFDGNSGGSLSPFVWSENEFSSPSANGIAFDINDHDEFVGTSADAATLWVPGREATNLHQAGFSESVATAINNRRDVLGYSRRADGTRAPFIWNEPTGPYNLMTLMRGAVPTTYPIAINESMQVIAARGATLDRLQLLSPSCEDALRDSLTVQVGSVNQKDEFVAGHTGTMIAAAFTPKLGLQATADLCGVDHFNWTNHLQKYPESWDFVAIDRAQALVDVSVVVRDVDESQLFNPLTNQPGEDVTYGVITEAVDPVQGDAIVGRFPIGFPLDENRAHYQEIPGPSNIRDVTMGDTTLRFFNESAFPHRWLASTDTTRDLHFVTQLVGMDSTGNVVREFSFPGVQTNFAWSTNADTTSNFAALSISPDHRPVITSGGIFDVRLNRIEAERVADGSFDSLDVGSQPSDGNPAGPWHVPPSAIVSNLGEGPDTEIFTIVPTDSFDKGAGGNSFRISGDSALSHHVTNELTAIITDEAVLRFDTFVPTGGGNGSVYLAGDHGRGGFGHFTDRGPQIAFRSNGDILASTLENPSNVVGTYDFEQWFSFELHVSVTDSDFDLWVGPRDGDLSLLANDIGFRSGPLGFIDRVSFGYFGALGPSNQYFDNVSVQWIASCDFDGSGTCDIVDIDFLLNAVAMQDAKFDLDNSGLVDIDDISIWLNTAGNETIARPYLPGDANLDGFVDATDLNAVGLNWQSTTAVSWSQGDFNADGLVNSADLNALGIHWQRTAAAAPVPEPIGWALGLVGMTVLMLARNKSDTDDQ